MNNPEYRPPVPIEALFPEAISAQSVKLVSGDEVLTDPTPTRRCIAFVSSDGKVLSEVHLNNGKTGATEYAQSAVGRLKEFYKGAFKVVLVGGDELISQHYVDAVIEALEGDKQIVFDRKQSDTGGVWVRHITAHEKGVKITRQERSWGEPQTIEIAFPADTSLEQE